MQLPSLSVSLTSHLSRLSLSDYRALDSFPRYPLLFSMWMQK